MHSSVARMQSRSRLGPQAAALSSPQEHGATVAPPQPLLHGCAPAHLHHSRLSPSIQRPASGRLPGCGLTLEPGCCALLPAACGLPLELARPRRPGGLGSCWLGPQGLCTVRLCHCWPAVSFLCFFVNAELVNW